MENILLASILLTFVLLGVIFFILKSKREKEQERIRKESLKNKVIKDSTSKNNKNLNLNTGNSVKKGSIFDQKVPVETRKKAAIWTQTESYDDDIKKVSLVKNEETPKESNIINILLVDDSLVVRKYVGSLLQNNGYNVILKNDGVEGLNYLQENKKPDLIISDIEMPNMNGFDFINNLRNNPNYNDTPILVISAHAESHIVLMENESIQGFIKKPFEDDDLLMQIDYLLEN